MKKLILGLLFLTMYINSIGQIENVIVETYYISDVNDATDTIGGILETGSKTYRIYVDLDSNVKISKIYGDINHPLEFKSSMPFFNNKDRGKSFGYQIANTKLKENTVALDTWLTIGMASNKHWGILKVEDTSASIIGGINNDGGSAEITSGLLINNDPESEISLVISDGLILSDSIYSFYNYGITDFISQTDSTIFGSLSSKNSFISNDALLMYNSGINGINSENKILIGQFTTKGNLEFKINLELILADGTRKKFVANNGIIFSDEKVSPFLTYPFVCGCLDPNYIEYSETFACNNISDCKTPIVYGCMDPNACNFDSNVNFNIDDLCCYPGRCNDRDISIVCPSLNIIDNAEIKFFIYPNPVVETIILENNTDTLINFDYEIINYNGNSETKAYNKSMTKMYTDIDVSFLEKGIYVIQITSELGVQNIKFLKK